MYFHLINTHILFEHQTICLHKFQRIQDEIDSRARKFDFLDEAALFLIQKGDSTDAITTQAEIDSFRQYHRQVLDRVAITNARLSAMQVSEETILDVDKPIL
jgi:hypothetical protein